MSNTGPVYNNKIYTWLKWAVQIVLPAVATLYFALGSIWGFPNVEQVVASFTAVITFLGITLGVSSHNYKKDHPEAGNKVDGIIQVTEKATGGLLYDLVLSDEPQKLQDKTKVVFKVDKA